MRDDRPIRRRPNRALMLAGAMVVGSCSVDDDSGARSERFVVAVDVAVPAGAGDWNPDAADSQLCTHRSRESVVFTASAADGSALVETFGSEPVTSSPLGATSGNVIDGACTNLLVLDVATLDDLTLTAASADGTPLGEFSTSPIETELDTGLAGRRSPGSPWTLEP